MWITTSTSPPSLATVSSRSVLVWYADSREAYDLNKTGQNYSALYDELKASSSWWHYLDSTWLISTQESADQLSSRLLRHLDQNDRLLVIKVVRPFQGFLTEKAWEWIWAHVTDS